MILALVMALALVACGNKNTDDGKKDDDKKDTPTVITNPDEVQDEMTSSDGKYEVAFVTDVGQLKDKSFNQGTYDGVKLYAANNNLSYKYYQPANGSEATADERIAAKQAAVDNSAKVVVCAGYLQEAALRMAAKQFTDVSFVFIDGYPVGEEANVKDSPALKNIAGIAFKEEQCGYLAGYAVVKEGYTKLGFSGGGGGTNPACCRYGYGFVQGADAAAKELNEKVEINYSWQYGANYNASPELQTMAAGWYQTGTEVIFACGGSMFASISAAAAAEEGKVVGVDVDQSSQSVTVVSSAMKGLADAVQWAVAKVYDGTFDTIGGQQASLGAADNAVELPTGADSWRFETFNVEEYESLYQQMVDGTLVVDDDYTVMDNAETATNWSNVNVNII